MAAILHGSVCTSDRPRTCPCLQDMANLDLPTIKTMEGKTTLELLCGISGAFQPGVLTALMGVSGAGKTTLMDVLAGRKTGAPRPDLYQMPRRSCVKTTLTACWFGLQAASSRATSASMGTPRARPLLRGSPATASRRMST